MIKPDDLKVGIRDGIESRSRELRCTIGVVSARNCVPAALEYATREVRHEVWHAIYGELYGKLNELRYKAHQALSTPAAHSSSLDKEICDLIELVKNPF